MDTVLKLMSIQRYISLLLSEPFLGKMRASKLAAHHIFNVGAATSNPNSVQNRDARGEPYVARLIRMWADYFVANGGLKESRRGKHQKLKSIINDEDVESLCREWLATHKETKRGRCGVSPKVFNLHF